MTQTPAVPGGTGRPTRAPRSLRADRRELRLDAVRGRNLTVDIAFDGHRVWSTQLPPANRKGGLRRVPWPVALTPYLHGTSTVSVRSSATGEELVSAEVAFGGPGRTAVTDSQGRWLAMNKWDRLGPTLEGDPSGVRDRLLTAATLVAKYMEDWGYPVYMVGGTLLGAMRTGELLPHDDDIDFAFWCDESDPQDVTLVGFEVQRKLEEVGYTVVRHSHTHLEIVYLTEDGHTDYYIDIFTGFHSRDGLYNQPFALRGELARSDLLPARPLTVSGVDLPAPATPEAWLAFAYGRKWRVPDPSFRWEIPLDTKRFFANSFGAFNRQRVFWEKTWMKVDRLAEDYQPEVDDGGDVERFCALLPPSSVVVDLGCGDGQHTERIAAAGHRVIGVDYSFEALRAARQTRPDGVEYRFLNLNDRHQLLGFALDLVDQGVRPYFFARGLLHQMPQLGRTDVLVAMRQILTDDTFLFATVDVDAVPRLPGNPQTWRLPVRALRREAWRWKLGTTLLAKRQRPSPYGERTTVTALVGR